MSIVLKSPKTIPVKDKIAAMPQINELAGDGWRINQMSTNSIINGSGISVGMSILSPGYNVVVIMEKEQLKLYHFILGCHISLFEQRYVTQEVGTCKKPRSGSARRAQPCLTPGKRPQGAQPGDEPDNRLRPHGRDEDVA